MKKSSIGKPFLWSLAAVKSRVLFLRFSEYLNFLRNFRIIVLCICFYACFFLWDFSFGRVRKAMTRLDFCRPRFWLFSFPLFFARSDIFSCRSIICHRIHFLGISSIYFAIMFSRRFLQWSFCAFCLKNEGILFRALKIFFRFARDFTPFTFHSEF